MEENRSITLSQLQNLVGNAIRSSRDTQNVWVQAEFSDMRVVGGHCYMELIEKDAQGRTVAKMRAMIWSGTLGALRRKFIEGTRQDLSNGIKVMVRGSATHHVLYGLSFTIQDINPDFTLGDLERQRREILERLMREGVANRNRELPVPVAPRRIAVISAAGAAGYGDFTNQLLNNSEGFVFYPMLFGAAMQGDRTAPSIIDALDKIESTVDFWDMVVIIRGGGATSDLNGFDNLELARRVALCPIPVAVGIGHERDRNVLDELACVRCKTPTAVATWLIDNMRDAYGRTIDLMTRIARYGTEAMRGEHLRLSSISQAIPAYARTRLLEKKMQLGRLSQELPAKVRNPLTRQRLGLASFAASVERVASRHLADADTRLKTIARELDNDSRALTQREDLRLKRLGDMLRILDPRNTLRRGYSITRVNRHAITDPADIGEGDVIETTIADGYIRSIVTGAGTETN